MLIKPAIAGVIGFSGLAAEGTFCNLQGKVMTLSECGMAFSMCAGQGLMLL
jgi:hypothetical protein